MESIEMSISKSEAPRDCYTVKAGDSLMSIAARIGNVTPAQLARFNRLGMFGSSQPPLFPGQRLYIPNKGDICGQNVRLRHLPGAATRVRYLSDDLLERRDCETDRNKAKPSQDIFSSATNAASHEKAKDRPFVKVKAKRVLFPTKSEIDGVLIVTPDAVYFDSSTVALALVRRDGSPPFPSIPSEVAENVDVEDGGSGQITPSQDPMQILADSVHDICIPMMAVVSLNTHGDMKNLLSGCRLKASKSLSPSKDFPTSAELDITGSVEALEKSVDASSPKDMMSSSPSQPKMEEENSVQLRQPLTLPEEVFISIGVDTEHVFSCVSAKADYSALSEAASTSPHVFKIPLYKLADIHGILASATNLATSQQDSPTNKSPSPPPTSMIESALEEIEKGTIEISLMGETSCILDETMLKDLASGLPANRVGGSMRLIFSTAKDGFSLNTLYRKTSNVQDVNLLLIRDQQNAVFGALLSERMHCSQHFYGTGESCVFHWRDGFKCYNWTKKNYFFMQGSRESFLIGAKSGHSAIWFDGDLKYGRSEATDTFDNPVLCSLPKSTTSGRSPANREVRGAIALSVSSSSLRNTSAPSSVPFIISALEVWEMVR